MDCEYLETAVTPRQKQSKLAKALLKKKPVFDPSESHLLTINFY